MGMCCGPRTARCGWRRHPGSRRRGGWSRWWRWGQSRRWRGSRDDSLFRWWGISSQQCFEPASQHAQLPSKCAQCAPKLGRFDSAPEPVACLPAEHGSFLPSGQLWINPKPTQSSIPIAQRRWLSPYRGSRRRCGRRHSRAGRWRRGRSPRSWRRGGRRHSRAEWRGGWRYPRTQRKLGGGRSRTGRRGCDRSKGTLWLSVLYPSA